MRGDDVYHLRRFRPLLAATALVAVLGLAGCEADTNVDDDDDVDDTDTEEIIDEDTETEMIDEEPTETET